jgi:hypothetical protein
MPLHRDAPGARIALAARGARRAGRRAGLGGRAHLAAPERVANRALGHAHLLRRLADRPPLAEQLRHALLLVGGEPMRAARAPLAVHDPQHARRRELAPLAVERAAIHGQGDTELLLSRQTQRHQLPGGHALADPIVDGMHEHRHARGEIRDLAALAHPCHHGVDLLGPFRRHRHVQLGRHARPPSSGALIITHPRTEVTAIRTSTASCQEP